LSENDVVLKRLVFEEGRVEFSRRQQMFLIFGNDLIEEILSIRSPFEMRGRRKRRLVNGH